MAFPDKNKIKNILNKIENKEGTLAMPKDASPLDKFRFQIQQEFVRYKLENKLTGRKLAELLEVDEAKVSKILRHRLSEFSTDRLIQLLTKLNPKTENKIAG